MAYIENTPAWQFNVIPGNANQGAILLTRNPLTNPPFKQSDFIWKPMEDIIGTADIKLKYSEEDNIFSLYKAKGHLDNEGSWSYQWELVGQWEPITKEVAEALRSLVYVSYRYDLSIPNTLKVYGTRKDGTEDLMCEINFVSAQVLQQAVETLNNAIAAETTRATNREDEIAQDLSDESNRAITREDELEAMIQQATINPGAAIEVVGDNHVVNVKYDNSSIKLNGNNELYADVIDDESTGNDKTLSAQKIYSLQVAHFTYKGDLNTMTELYDITGQQKGDVYYVVETGNYYIWNGTLWRDMEPDYTEGNGISINNRVIAVKLGEGLEFHNQQVRTKLGQGMMYDANYNLKVKCNTAKGIDVDNDGVKVIPGNGIVVDANGVNITTGDTTQIVSDKVEVKPDKGLVNETTGLSISANFSIKDTPLGTEGSKLALYSDGKIAVDFEENPVYIQGDLLYEYTMPIGINYVTNVTVPNAKDYDMFYFEHTGLFGQYIPKPASTTAVRPVAVLPDGIGAPGSTPSGMSALMMLCRDVNFNSAKNGTISRIDLWFSRNWGTWEAANSTESSPRKIRIYGMKAK